MKEQKWQLFVDESGPFVHIEDRSCVLGFLSRAPTEIMQIRVQTSLEKVFPEIPWPYHANLLNRGVTWLFWAARTPSALTHDACALLAGAPEQAQILIERVKEQLEGGQEPAYEHLTQIEKHLRFVDGFKPFCMAARERRNAFLRLLRYALEVDTPGTNCAVMATLGTPHGAAIARDPYLSGLTVLLERTAHALSLLGGTHIVDLHVATRNVLDPVLDTKVKLNRSHLEFASKNACFDLDKVRFSLNETLPFQHATAGLVLADILANRAYQMRSSSLQNLLDSLSDFGVQAIHTGLPFCASVGIARDEILQGPQADPEKLREVKPTWAREQAEAWIAAHKQEGK